VNEFDEVWCFEIFNYNFELMDWQFEVRVRCNGVPESCIVVPNH